MSNKRRPKVFIPNRSAHDFSAAERFGTIHYVTTGSLNRFAANDMVRAAMLAFKDAQEDDYILLSSLTVLCSVICSVFSRKFGRVNLLIFDGEGYVERTVVIDNVLEEV